MDSPALSGARSAQSKGSGGAGVSALSAKCQHTNNKALKLSLQRMATLNKYDTYLTSEPLTPDKLRGE